MNKIESIATQIIDAAVKIHKTLGPGLLESAYQACLAYELRKRGLTAEYEVIQPNPRLRSLVPRLIFHPHGPVMTYLKFRNGKLGFIINWHMPPIKDGIKLVALKKMNHNTLTGTRRTRRENDQRQKTDDRRYGTLSHYNPSLLQLLPTNTENPNS